MQNLVNKVCQKLSAIRISSNVKNRGGYNQACVNKARMVSPST